MVTLPEMIRWCEENDKSFDEAADHFQTEIKATGGSKLHPREPQKVPEHKIRFSAEAEKFVTENWGKEAVEKQIEKELKYLAKNGCEIAKCQWFSTVLMPGQHYSDSQLFVISSVLVDDGGIVITVELDACLSITFDEIMSEQ